MRALFGEAQHYAWGSPTAIPEILGIEPDGRPWAELWLGAHPAAPSKVDDPDSGTTLDQFLAAQPHLIGSRAVEEFGPRLPYLLKILAAKQALSLQTHPSRAEAQAGFAREEAAGIPIDAPHRLYVDDWPKPEIMVALEDFHALCGFRAPAETADLFDQFGDTGLDDVLGALRDPDPGIALRKTFTAVLTLPRERVDAFVQLANPHIHAPGQFGQFANTAVEIAADYPGDPGVLAALLMNRILLRPNEGIFLEADVMHAYLRGSGIELMANSNNVLRGGLTEKHVDVPELSRLVHFAPYDPIPFRGVPQGPGTVHYPVPVPEFALWRMDVNEQPLALPAPDRGRIVLATSGPVTITSHDGALTFSAGSAAWLDASEDGQISGDGTVWIAASGA